MADSQHDVFSHWVVHKKVLHACKLCLAMLSEAMSYCLDMRSVTVQSRLDSEMLACTAVDTVGSASMPGNVAGIVKVVSQVRSIAQLLCCAGAAHRGIEGPLTHQITILCMHSDAPTF